MKELPADSAFAIAILAGGESRRMGQDKANLLWQGETLLARASKTAAQVASSVIVAGRERPDNWALPEVLFLRDARPGEGPLRGLEAGLERAGPRAVLAAIACDMPLLTADALRWLLAQADNLTPNLDGVAVRNNEQWEPLFSLYGPRCLPRVHENLAQGQRSLHRLIETGEFFAVEAPAWVRAQLVNVNTPADLAALS